jgi:hypothetical protein
MSDKPQAPKSDVFGRTTYTVQYEIDGVRYFEERSLDVTNGNFLKPLGIKKVNDNQGFVGLGQELYTTIDPESEEGKKVLNSMIRRNKLVDFAKDWAYNDDETMNAADESGYLDFANERSGYSFINEKGVPNPEKNNEQKENALTEAEITEGRVFQESIQVEKENLFYPSNLEQNKGEDYIFIEQFEYSPPQPSGTVTPGQALQKGVPRTTNLEDSRGTCRLPIPNKLGVSNGVSWGEARANAIELAAFDAAAGGIGGAIGGSKNIGQLLQEGFGSGGKILSTLRDDFKNTTGSEANSASVISAALARSVLGSIGINVDVDQFITRQTGAAINPNLELLFGGPQLRTFSFNFNFAPQNTEEAVMIRKIQRWFRQGMLPTRSLTTGDRNLFLGSPNVFRLQYKNENRRIKGLNIIKVCALTACQIDFTPDGTYQSYDDQDAVSMPVRSTMGLTFNELTPLFKDDYFTPTVPYNDLTPQSVKDLGTMVTGQNSIDENDIGF